MNINIDDVNSVLEITNLVIKFGLPLVTTIVKAIEENNPSIASIHELREQIKDPEEYY